MNNEYLLVKILYSFWLAADVPLPETFCHRIFEIQMEKMGSSSSSSFLFFMSLATNQRGRGGIVATLLGSCCIMYARTPLFIELSFSGCLVCAPESCVWHFKVKGEAETHLHVGLHMQMPKWLAQRSRKRRKSKERYQKPLTPLWQLLERCNKSFYNWDYAALLSQRYPLASPDGERIVICNSLTRSVPLLLWILGR